MIPNYMTFPIRHVQCEALCDLSNKEYNYDFSNYWETFKSNGVGKIDNVNVAQYYHNEGYYTNKTFFITRHGDIVSQINIVGEGMRKIRVMVGDECLIEQKVDSNIVYIPLLYGLPILSCPYATFTVEIESTGATGSIATIFTRFLILDTEDRQLLRKADHSIPFGDKTLIIKDSCAGVLCSH